MSNKSILDDVWESTVGGLNWLKSVLIGEFSDNRSLSAVIADMLVSFVPGVIIVTSARDAVAVIVRLAHHPEKRQELMEWVLLSACLITLALPLAMAAGGAVAAGVGAIVGGVAGSELAAALRAVMLLLIKEASKLGEILRFLQKFMHGDIALFLRSIKFSKYEKVLLMAFDKTVNKLLEICRALRAKLEYVSYFDDVKHAIARLSEWERKFYSVQQDALRQLPRAVAELDRRLAELVAQVAPKESHIAVSGLETHPPAGKALSAQRVRDPVGSHLAESSAGSHIASLGESKSTAVTEHGSERLESKAASSTAAPSQIKDKPDKVESVAENHNTKRQETAEPDTSDVTAPKAATTQEYGVAFFGPDNLKYYTPANATIGRTGRSFFLMPLEDSGIVKNAGDAARYTGMAPSAQEAYKQGLDIYGLSFPVDAASLTKPTAADAMGWDHYLEGGHTAVKLGDGPTAGYLLNPTREFVMPGGNGIPPGSVLFQLGPDGEWMPIKRY
ncbi:hypothetical protein [Duganella rhizosphaerae]|uniref:hypothetical protein n=1 Tax=Duganella rhizosphaerae TaxID=2885763 RepID=UPI00403F10F6